MINFIKKIIYRLLDKFFQNKSLNGQAKRKKFNNLEDLISSHFKDNFNHPCKETLYEALKLGKNKELTIIETGSSAWGTNSSVLFDSYVNSFGGSLISVDIRSYPMLHLKFQCSSKSNFYCNDSLVFLNKLILNNDEKKNKKLVYLDSFDVDWENPFPAMQHGLNEFIALEKHLVSGDIILIDDTPKNFDILKKVQGKVKNLKFKELEASKLIPGKGALIKDYINKKKSCEILEHSYQLLLKFI